MAKSIILDVFEKTLGKYVLNLDTDSLNVALWKGKIELFDLQLDADAINRELALKKDTIPFRVVKGYLRNVRIVVPWARISSRPILIRAQDVKIIVEPCDGNLSDDDPTMHNGNNITKNESHIYSSSKKRPSKVHLQASKKHTYRREQHLHDAEEYRQRVIAVRKLANMSQEEVESDGSSNGDGKKNNLKRQKSPGSFGAKLVRKIIENLQVEIENVHFALRGSGCAAGIKLDAFTLITTDEDGNKKFVDRVSNSKNISKSFMYKSFEIKGFGVYCNEHVINTNRTIPGIGDSSFSTNGYDITHIDDNIVSYVLLPISFKAKLRQSDCITCVGFPKYCLSSKLSSIFIVITRNQLELVNNLLKKTMSNISKRKAIFPRPLFPEYRPIHPIGKGNSKQWWKYAVRCIGRLNRRRSWTEFFIAFQKRKRYIYLFQRSTYHSECSWMEPLSKSEKKDLFELEMDPTLSIEAIIYWRNLVDTQTLAEKSAKNVDNRKHRKNKLKWKNFSPRKTRPSRKSKKLAAPDDDDDDDDDDSEVAEIVMATEFLDVLKSVKSELSSKSVVSSDSMLCDIKFTLESLRIDLVTFSSKPLTSFLMGTASAKFLKNADSSFVADFSLLNLSIEDFITSNSLFPSILRCHNNAIENDVLLSNDCKRQVLKIKATKNRFGDKDLKLTMASFEIVASPLLVEELKRFINFSDDNLTSIWGLSNSNITSTPIDKNNYMPSYIDNAIAKSSSTSERFSDKLASSLVDAWKSKVEKENKWSLQVHVHSPIVIIPESRNNLISSIMLINLGSFKFIYGQSVPSLKMKEWFKTSELSIDYCSLVMKHMSIMIGNICDINTDNLNLTGNKMSSALDAMIEPISLSLEIGIENDSNLFGRGRKCMFGELPSISIQISPNKIKNVFSIMNTWSSILLPNRDDVGNYKPFHEKNKSSKNISLSPKQLVGSLQSPKGIRSKVIGSPYLHSHTHSRQFHVDLSLHKLSLKLYNDHNECIEANLVSVVASTSQMKNGLVSLRLRMGWFWILNGLQSDLPLNQRFIAHSKLPQSGNPFSNQDPNMIMEDLKNLGVFETNYSGSLDLADINISQIAPTTRKTASPVSTEKCINVDAKFTSLFINWNPNTVKKLLMFKNKILDSKEEFTSKYSPLLLQNNSSDYSVSNLKQNLLEYFPTHNEEQANEIHQFEIEKSTDSKFVFVVKAKMDSLEIKFHSAKDDLPLFLLTMAGSEVKVTVFPEEVDGMLMKVVVDDLRMEIPSDGKTCSEYRTILGLAPNQSTSLLSIQYGRGQLGLGGDFFAEKINRDTCEAIANVILSPMRFVHIHAQILTLMEYVTEGVLGALAAQVATSAAAAAIELAQAATGERIFLVKATGFDFIIPTSAYSSDNFALHAGDLFIRYKSLPNPGEYMTNLILDNVTMKCNQNNHLIDDPIKMVIDIISAPRNAPTPEDRSINIEVMITCVSFLLSKRHLGQIFRTLDDNLGEKNSFLRDETGDESSESGFESLFDTLSTIGLPQKQVSTSILTHSGVLFLEVQRRLCINFRMKTFSLELVNEGMNDSIICLTAVETYVAIRKIPEKKRISVDVTLLNLECEDRRPEASNSHFRTLISQISQAKDSHFSNQEYSSNIFSLSYTKSEQQNSKEMIIEIGSSQIIVIADVLAKILNFFRLSKGKIVDNITQKIYNSEECLVQVADVLVSEEDGAIETSLFSQLEQTTHTKDFFLKSSDCRFVFIDTYDTAAKHNIDQNSNIRETVTFRGKGEARISLVVDDASGINLKKDVEISSDNLEIYVEKYHLLSSPVQIMEPTHFSIFFTSDLVGSKQINDIKAVALSNIQLVVSMQNLAIIRAVLLNMKKILREKESMKETSDEEPTPAKCIDNGSPKSSDSISSVGNIAIMTKTTNLLGQPNLICYDKKSASPSKQLQRIMKVNVTLTQVEIVVINDLQALDEAVFKVTAKDVLSRAEATLTRVFDDQLGKRKNLGVTFNFFSNARVLANYFNSSLTTWQKFLLEPWEIVLKADRRLKKSSADRFTTLFDLECFPCKISFSEKFLISIGVAVSMWKTYLTNQQKSGIVSADKDTIVSNTTGLHVVKNDDVTNTSLNNDRTKALIDSLDTLSLYAIKNGLSVPLDFHVKDGSNNVSWKSHKCEIGEKKHFDFNSRSGPGFGARRLYGQDIKHCKSIRLIIMGKEILFNHLDDEVKQPKRVLKLNPSTIIFIDVQKESKTIVIYLSSHVNIRNLTRINFEVYQESFSDILSVGICHSINSQTSSHDPPEARSDQSIRRNQTENCNKDSKFSVPLRSINQNICHDTKGLNNYDQDVVLYISPTHISNKLFGVIKIPQINKLCQIAKSSRSSKTFEVVCKPSFEDINDELKKAPMLEDMTVKVLFKVILVAQSCPFVDIVLQPRVVLQNSLYANIIFKTSTEHFIDESTIDQRIVKQREPGKTHLSEIKPSEEIQIFKSGHTLFFSLFTDINREQSSNDSETVWIDVPLGLNQRCRKPIHYLVKPPLRKNSANIFSDSELLIIDSNDLLQTQGSSISSNNFDKDSSNSSLETHHNKRKLVHEDKTRRLFITAKYVVFDHSEKLTLERILPETISSVTVRKPFFSFPSPQKNCSISILDDSHEAVRLFKNSQEEVKFTEPFYIDNVPLSGKSLKASRLNWKDNSTPDVFVCRKLSALSQFEIHIMPEFNIQNYCKETVIVKQYQKTDLILKSSEVSIIQRTNDTDFLLGFHLCESDAITENIQVSNLGINICELKSINTGFSIGTLTIATEPSNEKSCFIISIEAIQYSKSSRFTKTENNGFFLDDFFRFRIRWSMLEITLNDTEKCDKINLETHSKNVRSHDLKIARIQLDRLTVDFQRIFKEGKFIFPSGPRSSRFANLRSQLSIMIQNVELTDCSFEENLISVLKYSSEDTSFLDLCVRTRGSEDSGVVKLDLVNLNLAHFEGVSKLVVINGNEEFLWKLLVIVNRTIIAIGELSGKKLDLNWNENNYKYPEVSGTAETTSQQNRKRIPYYDKDETIYDLKIARVSPISVLLSFKRQPRTSHHEVVKNLPIAAKLTNFFAEKLKFTIDNASLRFDGYIVKNMLAPKDSLVETFKSEYLFRMKFKLVQILKASSLDDWKSLAGREDGNEYYERGDLIRLTGNLAGKSAGYVLKKVGQGIGDGVIAATSDFGNEIEKHTEMIGARPIGACMNSLVSGIGGGLGNTVEGVVDGSGKILRGSVQGVGHIVGGVTGSICVMTDGVGEGLSSGDRKVIVSALENGVSTLGVGMERGAGAALSGAADGVVSVGKGVFKGAQSVYKGVGGVFMGCQGHTNVD